MPVRRTRLFRRGESMTVHPSHRGGLGLACSGFVILSCGDAVIKSISGAWPGTAVAALRFAIGAAGLGMLLWHREGRAGFAVPHMGVQALRGLCLGAGSLLFFLSIYVMPLAEATAIGFATPVIVALLSALLLREPIRALAWTAMALASAGVVAVLRPNIAELGVAALMPLAAAFAMAGFFLLNRRSAGHVSPLAAQFWVAAWVAPFQFVAAVVGHASGTAALAVGWPDWTVVARCALVALTASTAHYLVFQATMRASAAAIVPASYVQIIVALGIGILAFGDWPDAAALAGTAAIIAAGLLLWWSAAPPAGSDSPPRSADRYPIAPPPPG